MRPTARLLGEMNEGADQPARARRGQRSSSSLEAESARGGRTAVLEPRQDDARPACTAERCDAVAQRREDDEAFRLAEDARRDLALDAPLDLLARLLVLLLDLGADAVDRESCGRSDGRGRSARVGRSRRGGGERERTFDDARGLFHLLHSIVARRPEPLGTNLRGKRASEVNTASSPHHGVGDRAGERGTHAFCPAVDPGAEVVRDSDALVHGRLAPAVPLPLPPPLLLGREERVGGRLCRHEALGRRRVRRDWLHGGAWSAGVSVGTRVRGERGRASQRAGRRSARPHKRAAPEAASLLIAAVIAVVMQVEAVLTLAGDGSGGAAVRANAEPHGPLDAFLLGRCSCTQCSLVLDN